MNEKIKITIPTSQAKNTPRLLNYYPIRINHKAIHTSILKHITHYSFCELFNLLSSREHTSFPSKILICNPSKSLSLISFSCIDNTVCLASSILHDCIQKIPKPSTRNVTSFFLSHSNSTGKIYRRLNPKLSCNYYSGTRTCCSGVLLIKYKSQ